MLGYTLEILNQYSEGFLSLDFKLEPDFVH